MNLSGDLLKLIKEKREFCRFKGKLFQEVPERWRTVVIEHQLLHLFSYNMDTIQWLVNMGEDAIIDWLYQNYSKLNRSKTPI